MRRERYVNGLLDEFYEAAGSYYYIQDQGTEASDIYEAVSRCRRVR